MTSQGQHSDRRSFYKLEENTVMNRNRPFYALFGLALAGAVDLIINLLAAAIQQRTFADRFNDQSIALLAGLAVGGLLMGWWLGGMVSVPAKPSAAPGAGGEAANTNNAVITTRLLALLSYGKLRGRGIRLTDILLIGSRLDIDARETKD